MPFIEPSVSDVHVNGPLTNISLAFIQDAAGFVAGRVFPGIPSDKKSDVYFLFDRGDWNRDAMQVRAPATQSAEGTYEISTTNFTCVNRGFLKWIPDEVRSNQDSVLDQDSEAARFVSQIGLIKREVTWVAGNFVTGNPGATWTYKADGASSATAAGSFDPTTNGNNNVLYWNNAASVPIEDIRRGKRFVGESTGFRPNILTLQRGVYDALLDHPDIVARLDRGQTTNDHDFIGGKHALLSYRPPVPGKMTPSAGYTFNWNGYLGATEEGTRILRGREQLRHADWVEIESAYDQKRTSADLGYQFDDIIE